MSSKHYWMANPLAEARAAALQCTATRNIAEAISYNFHNGPFESFKSGKFIKMCNCLMLAAEPGDIEAHRGCTQDRTTLAQCSFEPPEIKMQNMGNVSATKKNRSNAINVRPVTWQMNMLIMCRNWLISFISPFPCSTLQLNTKSFNYGR